MIKCNVANMKKVIGALRSGQFRQVRNLLASESGGFCGQGVICELAWLEGAIQTKELHRFTQGFYMYKYDGREFTLPMSACKWLGLDACDTTIDRLAELNDKYKASFNDLATFLEDHYDLRDDPELDPILDEELDVDDETLCPIEDRLEVLANV